MQGIFSTLWCKQGKERGRCALGAVRTRDHISASGKFINFVVLLSLLRAPSFFSVPLADVVSDEYGHIRH